MFENDLVPGTSVQLMRRRMDFSYLKPRTDELFARVAAMGRQPLLAFYIDCAGRAGAYCGLDAEEADEVRKAIPPGVPLLGVYSGVEIVEVFDADPPSQRAGKLAAQGSFSLAMAAYGAGDFASAAAGFASILAANDDDGAAALLGRRSRKCLAEGWPAQWQGVLAMEK